MKIFFSKLLIVAMIVCAVLFIFLSIKELLNSTLYQWQAKIITEKGAFWADYEILDNNCLKIIKRSGWPQSVPFLYCGKYIIETP